MDYTTNYTLSMGDQVPYEFSPDERLTNILFVLERLQSMHQSADTANCSMWQREIERQLGNLNDAVTDMKPSPAPKDKSDE